MDNQITVSILDPYTKTTRKELSGIPPFRFVVTRYRTQFSGLSLDIVYPLLAQSMYTSCSQKFVDLHFYSSHLRVKVNK